MDSEWKRDAFAVWLDSNNEREREEKVFLRHFVSQWLSNRGFGLHSINIKA